MYQALAVVGFLEQSSQGLSVRLRIAAVLDLVFAFRHPSGVEVWAARERYSHQSGMTANLMRAVSQGGGDIMTDTNDNVGLQHLSLMF